MSRLFDNDNLDSLEHADITSARFLFNSGWTICAFFRVEEATGRTIIAKWGNAGSRQFLIRIISGDIQVFHNSVAKTTTLGDGALATNTWYVAIVKGTEGEELSASLYGIDGTLIDNDGAVLTGDESDLTQKLEIGVTDDAGDPMDGDIAYVAYFNTALVVAEDIAYIRNPYQVVWSKGAAGVEFFLPLAGNNSPEPELVHGRDFTVIGTPTKGENPPTGPFARPALRYPKSPPPPPPPVHSTISFVVPQ